MTTIPSNTCPQCGALIPEDSAHGLCPRCVFAKALAPTADGSFVPYVPPSLDSVRAAFPHLEVTALIGSGGMGAVFKARQPQLDRFVALKILPAELAGQPGFSERFQREAQALARLSHPHIVTVHDFGRAGDFYFLLMEFIDGVNLRQLLQTKRLTPKEALSIVPPICEALQCAHDHGIVHRDIKPENLLIDKAGTVKIADFGIAKIVDGSDVLRRVHDREAGESTDGKHPASSMPFGTPDYAAPEQASGSADHRADIYSLGVVLYEMLTGERPTARLEAPSKRVQVDIRIDEIVLRALEKSPELRFATAAEFRTCVENVQSSSSQTVTAGKASISRPWMLPTAALVLLCAGGILMAVGVYASQNWGWGSENAAMVAGGLLPLFAGSISAWRLLRERTYGELGPVPRAVFTVVVSLGLFALMRLPGSLWMSAARKNLSQSSFTTVMAVNGAFSQVVWAIQAGATFSLYMWTQRRMRGTSTKMTARMTLGCFVLLIVHSMAPWAVVAYAKLMAVPTTPIKAVTQSKSKQAAPVLRGRILDRTGVVLAECKRLNDRSYPLKTLASATLGSTAHSSNGLTLIGRSGIEHQYDDVLRAGHDLQMTLDVELQKIAEQALLDARVAKGAFAAINPDTGEVLALVSLPLQDLNSLVSRAAPDGSVPINQNGKNLAVTPLPVFELFQPVTALSGVLTGRGADVYRCEPVETRFRIPGGGVRYWGTTMVCRTSSMNNAAHGTLTLEQALMKSCSSYFYFLGNTIGYPRVLEMAENLGLQKEVDIFGARTSPVLPSLADFQKQYSSERQAAMQTAEFASGRACMASPLQVATIYATVASGLFCPPVLRMNDPDQRSRTPSRFPSSGAAGDGLASIRRALLRTVSDPDGRAHAAMSAKVVIGGMPVTKRLGAPAMPAGRLMNWTWFAGFATSQGIKLSFALFVEDETAKEEKEGERCGPIMRSILEAWDTSQQAKLNESSKPALFPAVVVTKPKTAKQPNEVPFKGTPQLRYIAWMPKDESGWQLRTPGGEPVTAPGDIPVHDWEWWKMGLLKNGTASKISDTAGWLMLFYSHPAIDERSESDLKFFTPAGAEIKVTQRVFCNREPKTLQADGWLATGCRVPYAAVKGPLKVRLTLTAGPWHSSDLIAAGKINNSGGGQMLTNSGEDASHRAFVTVVTEDEGKFPYYQWEVLGRLHDGLDVRNQGSTAVNFQSQYVHTISFGQPLASFAGFIMRSRERKNFTNDGVQVPPLLVATPESGSKPTLQMRWVQDKPAADTEALTFTDHGRNEALNVEKNVLLDLSALKSVEVAHWSSRSMLVLRFTESGGQRFAQVTREGNGRKLALVIDGQVRSAPMISAEIREEEVEFYSNLGYEEADDLVARLTNTLPGNHAQARDTSAEKMKAVSRSRLPAPQVELIQLEATVDEIIEALPTTADRDAIKTNATNPAVIENGRALLTAVFTQKDTDLFLKALKGRALHHVALPAGGLSNISVRDSVDSHIHLVCTFNGVPTKMTVREHQAVIITVPDATSPIHVRFYLLRLE